MNKKIDLMARRFKVVADYPNSFLRIGDILCDTQKDYEWWENNRDASKFDKFPGDFPAIFKLLSWWEERQVTEMPQYLKDEHGEVFRVYDYSDSSFVSLYKNNGDRDWPIGSHSLYELLPATESEYSQYIKSKVK